MNVIAPANSAAPPTAAGMSILSTAADYSTTGVTPAEIDASLRVTLTVTSTGKVRVRHGIVAWCQANQQDYYTGVQVDGAGGWTTVIGFNETTSNDFGDVYMGTEGEVELTGLSPGSHTFYMGWWTTAGRIVHIEPQTINAGMALGTWQAVVTLP